MIFPNKLIELLNHNLCTEDAKCCLNYLADRNISFDLIKEFNLGWYNSNKNFYEFSTYIDLLYLNEINNLTNRLLVPLYNLYDEVISFSGRIPTYKFENKIVSIYDNDIIVDKDRGYRKYPLWFHNSFFKRNYLYGLNKSYKEIIKKDSVIIVEGIFDLFSLYQNGIKNVVCLLGSKVTSFHFLSLLRFTDNIILLLDSDAAGEIGSNEAIDLGLKYNFNIRKINLPIGYDPSEFVYKYGIDYINSKIISQK